jgi:hypothetical protein
MSVVVPASTVTDRKPQIIACFDLLPERVCTSDALGSWSRMTDSGMKLRAAIDLVDLFGVSALVLALN